jgi:predicted AlkP superfamily pyrophosphatase or phosphodiesterase
MLHHVPQSLSQQMASSPQTKVALLVMDGMAYDQWLVMRQVLKQQMPQLTMEENGVFAWLPTTTSVSRQSLFSGKLPMEFASSIGETSKESKLWSTFWVDQGLMPPNIGYLKSLTTISAVEDLLANAKLKVLGLVVNQVDDIMHGMTLGTAGMHNQVGQWTHNGFLRDLCKLLLDRGFRVVITADHGNIEAIGVGNPKEGMVADKRGERVRVYPNAQLREQTQTQYPDTIEWPSTGLPNDYHALFPPPRKAFVNAEAVSVCHGGISLEEVIVPYIQLS